ncbi:gene transfer agent family protein [Sinorhizobium meliloti]|nr:gene transfer agent family protein [Sinorhizobium meliloti]
MENSSKRDARITREFADGVYDFCLNYGAIRLLQEARDMGPMIIFGNLQAGTWRIEDIREVIRCGLIGAGMAPSRAVKLCELYVESRPPMENMVLAQLILNAGLIGAPEEPVGEDSAASLKQPSGSTTSQTVN